MICAHEAIGPSTRLKNGPQHVRRIPEVFIGNLIVDRARFNGRAGARTGTILATSATKRAPHPIHLKLFDIA
jgi:hypothetical protein